MRKPRNLATAFALTVLTVLAVPPASQAAPPASSAAEIDSEAHQSLEILYRLNPTASALAEKAKAILVFPTIVKAGLIFGGSYGEGVLLRGDVARDYYNSVSGSYGVSGALPSGTRSYGYAVFLMTDNALNYLNRGEGWEFGIGPKVVLIDDAQTRPGASLKGGGDAYAFVYGQKGLMDGIGIDGTRVSRIHKS